MAASIAIKEKADESLLIIATITRARTIALTTIIPTQIKAERIEAMKSLRLPPRWRSSRR